MYNITEVNDRWKVEEFEKDARNMLFFIFQLALNYIYNLDLYYANIV